MAAPRKEVRLEAEEVGKMEREEPIGGVEDVEKQQAETPVEGSTLSETSLTSEKSAGNNNAVEKHAAHDSMVTVRLSEPPVLHIDTTNTPAPSIPNTRARSTSSSISEPGDGDETPSAETAREDSPRITMIDSNGDVITDPPSPAMSSRTSSTSSQESVDGEQVDWEELEKSEGQEPKDQWTDDVSGYTLSLYWLFLKMILIMCCG